MKSTYKSADKIIVFDNSLEIIDSDVAPEEALIRLRYSPWSTRLWTMQEGRLGRNLYFQFRDKIISFDNHPYQGGTYGSLQTVVEILEKLASIDVVSNACNSTYTHLYVHTSMLQAQSPAALLLIRALAYTDRTLNLRLSYAQKPPQDDPMEEDLRLSAIESFQDLQLEDKLHKTWHPIAINLVGETYSPTRRDDELRSNIHATIMSPIVSHCSEAWLRSRGFAYSIALNHESGSDHFKPGSKPSHMFDDTVRGLQGRTTSRIEDEPICLCALLGLDNTAVLNIPVPSPRKKRLLSSLISTSRLSSVCRKAGFDASATLSKCHDERMRTTLQLIDAFPPHIIFWNVPRLKTQGWRWAPSTFLGEDTQIRMRATVFAHRRPEGLLVNFQGWRVAIDQETIRGALRNDECVVLKTRAEIDGDDHPFRASWLRARLPGSRRYWRRFFSRNQDVALIVEEGKGALVAVSGVGDRITFTRFEAAIERLPPNDMMESATVFCGRGTWVEYSKWCIG